MAEEVTVPVPIHIDPGHVCPAIVIVNKLPTVGAKTIIPVPVKFRLEDTNVKLPL